MPDAALTDQGRSNDVSWRGCCWLFAAICLGIAIHVRDGLVHPGAIAWLSLALLGAAAAWVRLPEASVFIQRAPRALPWLIAGGVVVNFILLLASQVPGGARGTAHVWPYYSLIGLAAVASAGLWLRPRWGRAVFAVILLFFMLLGLWLLRTGGTPRIDVWTSQKAGLEALRHGRDPWSSTFPDVYHNPDLYSPGTVRDGVVHLGFPYPPLTVLLDLPGQWLAGDLRYGNLLAVVAAAVLIAYARPGGGSGSGEAVAVLFLFTPRALLVLRNGWTEPQVAMLLAAVVFCAGRAPKFTPWVVGLLLVSKQYMILAALPALLLISPPWRLRKVVSFGLKAAVAAAVVSLPLALWNWRGFLHSNFEVAAGAKFRLDALNYFAYAANVLNWAPPQWLGAASFVAALAVAVLSTRRAERSAAGFCGSVALMYLAFFALNKFAFCNYYYFLISVLCCASATALAPCRIMPAAETTPPAGSIPLSRVA